MDEKHEDILLQLHIERPLYEQEALNEAFSYERPQGSCKSHPTIQNCILKQL